MSLPTVKFVVGYSVKKNWSDMLKEKLHGISRRDRLCHHVYRKHPACEMVRLSFLNCFGDIQEAVDLGESINHTEASDSHASDQNFVLFSAIIKTNKQKNPTCRISIPSVLDQFGEINRY